MEVSQYYKTGRYTNQDQKKLDALFKRRFGYIKRALEGYKFKTVLDAACGDGKLVKLARDEWGVQISGADISKRAVEICNKLGIKSKVSDLSKKIPFEDKSFDMVLSSESIEHFVNPDKFLREVHRVLKPKGLLVITTPNLSSWLNRILFLFGIYPLVLEASTEKKVGLGILSKFTSGGSQVVGMIHVFNYRALRDILSYHGYVVEKVVGMPVDFDSPRLPLVTKMYRIADSLFSAIVPVSSNFVVVARKLK